MRIAVTGKNGQLVGCLKDRAPTVGVTILAIGRPELDLAHPASIASALRSARPDVVVNAAAITAVDEAESAPEATHAVNAAGAGHVAAAAAALGAPVIQVSTDYVFDGHAGRPYAEDDATRPLSVYGRSKLEGERLVAMSNPKHLIVRASWIYSPFGTNFLTSVLERARAQSVLELPAQQYGSPTSGLDLADAILHLAAHLLGGGEHRGVFHFAGRGSTNRADQARHIFEVSRSLGGPHAEVNYARTMSGRAPRPQNSSLSSEKFAAAFHWPIADWRRSTEAAVARLLSAWSER